MRIYVASSWRNDRQPAVVAALREAGHEVYDFRNPPNRSGFAWSQIDPDWEGWDAATYVELLDHPLAKAGFAADMDALEDADATVLVMPCGRSAHLELGFAVGDRQPTAVLLEERSEPELMYKMCDLLTPNLDEILDWLAELRPSRAVTRLSQNERRSQA